MEYFNTSTDANTGEVTITPYTIEQIEEIEQQAKVNSMVFNKQQAKDLLLQTDWTTIADVGNPQTANPYLANQSEFIAWRSQVRAIAVTPVAGTLPILEEMPQEDWQTV